LNDSVGLHAHVGFEFGGLAAGIDDLEPQGDLTVLKNAPGLFPSHTVTLLQGGNLPFCVQSRRFVLFEIGAERLADTPGVVGVGCRRRFGGRREWKFCQFDA
jgi:hypothetical protein